MRSNLTVLYDRMVSLPKCSLRMQLPMRQDLYPPAGVCLAIDRLDADHITTSPGDKIAARDLLGIMTIDGSFQGKQLKILSSNNHKGQSQCDS